MLEVLLAAGARKLFYPDSGPGPISAIGTDDIAYFGKVSNAELFTAPELASQVQELTGAGYTKDEVEWLKFRYYGKYLFIKRYPIFRSTGADSITTWQKLYEAGLIYGEDGPGMYKFGREVTQLRFVKKGDYTFKVRTITGDETGASSLGIQNGGLDLAYRKSMFTELLYRIWNATFENYPALRFEKFTDWRDVLSEEETCRELLVNSSYPDGLVLTRGLTTASPPYIAAYETYPGRNTRTTAQSWRPVLELVAKNELFKLTPPIVEVEGAMKGSVSNVQSSAYVEPSENSVVRPTDIRIESVVFPVLSNFKEAVPVDSNLIRLTTFSFESVNVYDAANINAVVSE